MLRYTRTPGLPVCSGALIPPLVVARICEGALRHRTTGEEMVAAMLEGAVNGVLSDIGPMVFLHFLEVELLKDTDRRLIVAVKQAKSGVQMPLGQIVGFEDAKVDPMPA